METAGTVVRILTKPYRPAFARLANI